MKNLKYIATLILLMATASCKKYLDTTPQGVVSQADLTSPANTDAMVIAAYSYLGNDYYFYPFSSMWAYGSIRSGDAYKGGGGPGDVAEYNQFETFASNNPTNGSGDNVFYQLYVGVGRCNTALKLVEGQDVSNYPLKIQREAELKFLRATSISCLKFYLIIFLTLMKIFKRVPIAMALFQMSR